MMLIYAWKWKIERLVSAWVARKVEDQQLINLELFCIIVKLIVIFTRPEGHNNKSLNISTPKDFEISLFFFTVAIFLTGMECFLLLFISARANESPRWVNLLHLSQKSYPNQFAAAALLLILFFKKLNDFVFNFQRYLNSQLRQLREHRRTAVSQFILWHDTTKLRKKKVSSFHLLFPLRSSAVFCWWYYKFTLQYWTCSCGLSLGLEPADLPVPRSSSTIFSLSFWLNKKLSFIELNKNMMLRRSRKWTELWADNMSETGQKIIENYNILRCFLMRNFSLILFEISSHANCTWNLS